MRVVGIGFFLLCTFSLVGYSEVEKEAEIKKEDIGRILNEVREADKIKRELEEIENGQKELEKLKTEVLARKKAMDGVDIEGNRRKVEKILSDYENSVRNILGGANEDFLREVNSQLVDKIYAGLRHMNAPRSFVSNFLGEARSEINGLRGVGEHLRQAVALTKYIVVNRIPIDESDIGPLLPKKLVSVRKLEEKKGSVRNGSKPRRSRRRAKPIHD